MFGSRLTFCIQSIIQNLKRVLKQVNLLSDWAKITILRHFLKVPIFVNVVHIRSLFYQNCGPYIVPIGTKKV